MKRATWKSATVSVLLGVALMFTLQACGGSSTPANSNAQSDTQQTAAKQQNAVIGLWKAESVDGGSNGAASSQQMSTLESAEGCFTYMEFKKDGTFTMNMYDKDTLNTQKGKWTDSETADATVDLNGTVSDVKVEGSTLNMDAQETGAKVVANKYTKSQLKKDKKKAKKHVLRAGKKVSGKNITFKVQSVKWADKIMPSDTSGYYYYTEAESGDTLLVAKIRYTNKTGSHALPGYSSQAKVKINDKYEYEGYVLVDGGSNLMKSYRIEAGDSDTVYVYASVPNKIMKKAKKAVINWDLLTEELNTYYNGSLSHASYRIKK